jgi:hypothetical protein
MPAAAIDSAGPRAIVRTMWRLLAPGAGGAEALPLQRRGVLHGELVVVADPAGDAGPAAEAKGPGEQDAGEQGAGEQGGDQTTGLAEAWAAARPIALPGILAPALPSLQACIADSRALFAHLREGGRFQDAVLALLEDAPGFRPEGSTVDRLEPREIEKVFVSGLVEGKRARGGRDVWAKLAWVAHDERDLSLRIRFSCGTEQLHDWHRDVAGQVWSDRFAEALFPECAAIAHNPELIALVQGLLGAVPRFSERIVYANAPGGGAVFHHDADPTQRGVVYGQLDGRSAWLALPVAELAQQVAAHATARGRSDLPPSPEAARARLDSSDDPALFALLNEDPEFTRRLAEAGWLSVLEPGDAMLLPSHDPDRVAWHSVFALGDEPGLAHSYGIFATGPA